MPEPASSHLDLTAPTLLIAMPQVLDPSFFKSVVLLLQQDDEGSFGLIVNRRTDTHLSEILDELDIEWAGDESVRAFFGGPVQPQLGSVLFTTGGDGRDPERLAGARVCAPGIGLTHHVGDLGSLAQEPPAGLRLFLGYAGWGAGQLVTEILRDDWLLAPPDPELIFSADPDRVWERALRSVGVDPAALPSWSTRGSAGGGGEDQTN